MNKAPRITVVIPVYNGANFLRCAIDSAINQTYNNIEVLIVDDGSTDNGRTQAIAKSYGSKVVYFYKKNGGVSSALNLGIRNMSGDYFSWLSHDDLYLPKRIEILVKNLKNNNEIIFSSYYLANFNLKKLVKSNINKKYIKNFSLWLLLNRSLNGCSLLIPRKIIKKNLFDETKRVVQDYDLWIRLAWKYRFIFVDNPLTISRQHELQFTNNHKAAEKEEIDSFYFTSIKQYLSKLNPKRRSFNKRVILELLSSHIKNGRFYPLLPILKALKSQFKVFFYAIIFLSLFKFIFYFILRYLIRFNLIYRIKLAINNAI